MTKTALNAKHEFALNGKNGACCYTFGNEMPPTMEINELFAPSFMMILTATGNLAYLRDDGILIVPLGCLKD